MRFRLADGIDQELVVIAERDPLRKIELARSRHIRDEQTAASSLGFSFLCNRVR